MLRRRVRMRVQPSDRGEVDIIGPSEGLGASSILAGRTRYKNGTSWVPFSFSFNFFFACAQPRDKSGISWLYCQHMPYRKLSHHRVDAAL